MVMETGYVSIAAALGAALAVAGVAIKIIFYSVVQRVGVLEEAHKALAKDLAKELTDLRMHNAEKFADKRDVKDSLDAIFKAVRRVEDKLDHKADKPMHLRMKPAPESDFAPLPPK
jgi:hypothetical protein